MTPPGTPTEWRAPQRAIETERTQGTAHTTREEGADQSTQPKPEGAMTLPGTPMEWRALKKAAREENANLNTPTKPEGATTPHRTPTE